MTIRQSHSQPPQPGQPIQRSFYLSLLRTAFSCGEYRFTRQAALQWLASFPGDLQVSQIYAQALIGEKRYAEARNVLRGLCQVDPEDEDTLQLWLSLEQILATGLVAKDQAIEGKKSAENSNPPIEVPVLQNWLTALNGHIYPGAKGSQQLVDPSPDWGEQLYGVRKDLSNGDYHQAEQALPAIIARNTSIPLAALTHLQVLQANPDAPLAARRNLAEFYHRRWPDCLGCSLLLAKWLVEDGASERGIALLHKTAIRDLSGQIARRTLGADHPYQSLWPDDPALRLELAIPASVAAALGWNQLGAGKMPAPDAGPGVAAGALVADASENPSTQNMPAGLEWAVAAGVAAKALDPAPQPEPKVVDEQIVRFGAELDQMAARLDQPPVTQFDGRFPVYVIFSVHSNLVARYGDSGAGKVEDEMKALAKTIVDTKSASANTHWGSFVYLPDRVENTSPLGLSPLKSIDPWSLKLALADLDRALAKKGELIGALLIVGGPEIVPFHNLPNPVDDPDGDVPSDNPYTTRDDNYFIPDWPVGRLPGGFEKDPDLLIKSLRRIRERHAAQPKRITRPNRWFAWVVGWLRPSQSPPRKGFGATAAIWRQASIQVYRPVGEARGVLVSPPFATNGNHSNGRPRPALPNARLAYFNLHGLQDAAEWYGQRDPAENVDGPDYPVALCPTDIRQMGSKTPLVVFSEACYGAHIQDKLINQNLALQFLENGAQVIAGSTTMAYGAISSPLIAADFLGYSFWKGMLEGLSAGEALQRAKIQLAIEMHQRQGYLDGEDQKTLISFVLLGDPLMRLSEEVRSAKYIRRPSERSFQVKTICDRQEEQSVAADVPQDVMVYVKQIVANYLPGMSDAHATYAAERAVCTAHGHSCPTRQFSNKNRPTQSPDRHVVILNKSMETAGHKHPQYARLTLDSHGKLVKIVVSR